MTWNVVLSGFEFFAAFLVAFGCVGELWLLFIKASEGDRERKKPRLEIIFEDVFQPLIENMTLLLAKGRLLGPIPAWREHLLERRFVVTIALGVVVELICVPLSLKESLDTAREIGQITQTNLDLSIELERLKNPRIISHDKLEQFIFLTKYIQKRQIKVSFPLGRNETANYARQIREMLTQAGFPQESNAPPFGATPKSEIRIRRAAFDKWWPSIILNTLSTNLEITSQLQRIRVRIGETELQQPIVLSTNVEDICNGLIFVLNEIGITAEWHGEQSLKPSDLEILVMDKP